MALAYTADSGVLCTDDAGDIQRICERMRARKKPVMVDTETTGFSPRHNQLVAIQLMQAGGPIAVFDVRHLSAWEYSQHLQALFDVCLCVGHNISFDYQFLAHNGMWMRRVYDTQTAEQVINGLGPKGMTLKFVTDKYAGIELSKEERNWFVGLNTRPEWTQPFPTEQLDYMADDVRHLPDIMEAQIAELKRRKMLPVMQLEMKALPAVASMELNGIRVDTEKWQAVINTGIEEAQRLEDECLRVLGPPILEQRTIEYDAALAEYEAWCEARDEAERMLKFKYSEGLIAGDTEEGWGVYKVTNMQAWRKAHPNPGKPKYTNEVNLGSHVQLMQAFQRLEIPAKTTAEADLERLAAQHPILRPLLDFKKANTMINRFGSDFLHEFVEQDGRLYPSYNLIGAETGRMSSYKPNWQAIPSKGAGAKLRNAVVASPGHSLLIADFSNIELRILADMSGDETMLAMFASGQDLHSFTARMMFNLGDDVDVKTYEVKPGVTARSVAKTINFGIAYGQSKYGFALKLNVSVEEAEGFIARWYALYAGAKAWLESIGQRAVEQGFSQTVLGRKRYYTPTERPRDGSWELLKQYNSVVSSIRRAGMNHPIQGTSADLTKHALGLFFERADRQAQRLVACVHDELVVECPTGRVEETKALLGAVMYEACTVYLKRVTLPPVEVKSSLFWEK